MDPKSYRAFRETGPCGDEIKSGVERPSRMLYSHLHPAVFSVLAEDLVHWLSEQLVVRRTNKVAQTCCGYL